MATNPQKGTGLVFESIVTVNAQFAGRQKPENAEPVTDWRFDQKQQS